MSPVLTNPLKASFPSRLLSTIISHYFSFRQLVYGYANARVHGMFANLLTTSQFEEMISSRSVTTITEILERTKYKKELVDLSLKFKGEDLIELALSNNFSRFANQLLKITPKQTRSIISALLTRWDAHNLKTIILARKQKKKYEQIAPYLMLAGTLTKPQLTQLLSAESTEDFYSKLRHTQFGMGLLSMPSSPANGSVRQMILSMGQDDAALEPLLALLDVYAYKSIADVAQMSHREAKEVEPLLSRYADEKNLSTVLRLTMADASEEKAISYLVPGGKILKRQWKRIFALKDIPKMLEAVSFKLSTQSALERYQKTKKISDIEVELSLERARKSLRQFRHAQLSVAVIVGALLLKEQEVSNIRKVIRAKSLGLPHEQIRAMLVLVK